MLSPLASRLSKLRRHDITLSESLISFLGEAAQNAFREARHTPGLLAKAMALI